MLVTGNTAGGSGGGIYHGSNLSLSITDSIIATMLPPGVAGDSAPIRGARAPSGHQHALLGNSAGASGGGLNNNSGAATIIGSTFVNNNAAALLITGISGGGVYTQGNTLDITNSTISGNTMPGGVVGAAITAQRGVVTSA